MQNENFAVLKGQEEKPWMGFLWM